MFRHTGINDSQLREHAPASSNPTTWWTHISAKAEKVKDLDDERRDERGD
jgi:hypothetical protein